MRITISILLDGKGIALCGTTIYYPLYCLSYLGNFFLVSCYSGEHFTMVETDPCGDLTDAFTVTDQGLHVAFDSASEALVYIEDTTNSFLYEPLEETGYQFNHDFVIPFKAQSDTDTAGLDAETVYNLQIVLSVENSTATYACGEPYMIDTAYCDNTEPTTIVADPLPGTYGSNQTIMLQSTDEHGPVTIYYTSDGSDPTTSSSVFDDGSGIAITDTTTIKAIATDECGNTTSVSTYTYTIIKLDPPTATPPGGDFTIPECVVLDLPSNADEVRYTTNGSTPTQDNGILYSTCINISEDVIIKAVAVKNIPNKDPIYSSIITEVYAFDSVPPTSPTVNIASGVYSVDINDLILHSVDDRGTPTIYYTLNGEKPLETTDPADTLEFDSDSPLDFPVGLETVTLRAVAVDGAGNKSEYATFVYTFVVGPNTINPPIASPQSDIYDAAQTISFTSLDATCYTSFPSSCTTPAEWGNSYEIYYTTNGVDPTTSDSHYTGPFTLSSTATLKAMVYNGNGSDPLYSTVSTYNYTIDNIAPSNPTANIPSGSYPTEQVITLSSDDNLALLGIYYCTYTPGDTPCSVSGSSDQYMGPISVSEDTCFQAIAIDVVGNESEIKTFCYTIDETVISPPYASPVEGFYTTGITVKLTKENASHDIYYMNNPTPGGPDPDPNGSSILYSGGISVNTNRCIRAISVLPETGATSAVIEACYYFDTSPPTNPQSSITPGSYQAPQTIILSSTDDIALAGIHYTLDGSVPTLSSPLFSGNITISEDVTIKAFAVDQSGNVSGVEEFIYIIDSSPPTKPTATPPGGLYGSAQTVTILASDNKGGFNIYYTDDGTQPNPTDGSQLYTSDITVDCGTAPCYSEITIQAVAKDALGNISPLMTEVYYIDKNPPVAPSSDVVVGTYGTDQNVNLSSHDNGDYNDYSEIYYTTDGTDPEKGVNGTLFESGTPIVVSTTQTIKAIAYDEVGNESTVSSYIYTIDKNAPTGLAANPDSGSYSTHPDVVLTATDPTTPVTIYYEIQQGSIPSDPTTSSPVYGGAIDTDVELGSSADMTFYIVAIAEDGVGNLSLTETFTYNIISGLVDPPVLDPSTPETTAPDERYTTNPVTVKLNEGSSGADEIYYTTNGTDPTTGSTSCSGSVNPCTFTIDFGNTDNDGIIPAAIEVRAISELGASVSTSISSFTFVLDDEDPDDPSSSLASGWYRTQKTVTLSSSDINPDSDTSQYTIYYETQTGVGEPDPGTLADPTSGSTEYTAALTIGGSPPTTMSYTIVKAIAYDEAGNNSGVTTFVYRFDSAAPNAPVISPSGATPFNSASVTVTLNASDTEQTTATGSPAWDGATVIYYEIGGTPDPDTSASVSDGGTFDLTTEGVHVVKAMACDSIAGNGNCSAVSSTTYTIDRTAPIEPTATPNNSPSYYFNTATLNVTLASGTVGGDPDSNYTIYYNVGSSPSNPTCSSFDYDYSVDNPAVLSGSAEIRAIACDPAGNASAVMVEDYIQDLVPPDVPTISLPEDCYSSTQTGVTLSSDDTYGYTIYYKLVPPMSSFAEYSSDLTIDQTQDVVAYAQDEAGNQSSEVTFNYTIDSSPPTNLVISPAGGTYANSQTVSITVDDNLGAEIYYTTDGSTPDSGSTHYDGSFTVSSNQTVTAIAYDCADGSVGPESETYTITNDSTPPVITWGPYAVEIGTITAKIVWNTDELSTSVVRYSTNASDLPSGGSTSSTSGDTLAHVVDLSGLSASTIYYYVVESEDPTGNTTVSSIHSFQTGPSSDTDPPDITGESVTNVDCSFAIIQWTTDEAASSQVVYSTSDGFDPSTEGTRYPTWDIDGANKTSHSITINGLTSATQYYYYVRSYDASGNESFSASQGTFTTTSVCDNTPPKIVDSPGGSTDADPFTSGISDVSATINWFTDEYATSQVVYSTTSPVTSGTYWTYPVSDSDGANLLTHSIQISGLLAETTYYYYVHTEDAAGNSTNSLTFSFDTGSADLGGFEDVDPTDSTSGGLFGEQANQVAILPDGRVMFASEDPGTGGNAEAKIFISDSSQTNITYDDVDLGNSSFDYITALGVATFDSKDYVYAAGYGSQWGISRWDMTTSPDTIDFNEVTNNQNLNGMQADHTTAMLGGDGYLYIGGDDSNGAYLFVANGDPLDALNEGDGDFVYVWQGTGDQETISDIELWNGNVYISVADSTSGNGAKIYSIDHSTLISQSSNTTGLSWTDVTTTYFSGFSTNNVDISSIHAYNGYLWVGTENASGAQLWKWDGTNAATLEMDFNSIDSTNKSIEMIQSNAISNLYFGTGKVAGTTSNTNQAEIWKSSDAGENFSQIGVDGFDSTPPPYYNTVTSAASTGSTIYILMNDENAETSDVFRFTE